jgi:alkanesulfonate monooxygenase SsuD/methylene tetrahydromethanopterin reductase-like flavin-dependent oxidoreductase (luciferase family)
VVLPESDTIKLAGSRGYMPLSIYFNNAYTLGLWESYAESAENAGIKPDRRKWRLYTEILVADTDTEAERLAFDGPLGRACREYLWQFCSAFGFLKHLKHDPSMSDEEVTPEYFMKTSWIIGSVETVTDRIVDIYETTGGFGTLLWSPTDWGDQPERMRHTLELLIKEVLPKVNKRVTPLPALA